MNPRPPHFSLLVFVLVGLGVGILVISLLSASRVAVTGAPKFSEELRFKGEILPGHIFYPLVAIFERLDVLTAYKTQQCPKRLALAQKRREQAVKLLEINEPHSALETFVRSQNYLANSVDYCRDDENNSQQLLAEINQQLQSYQTAKPRFTDADRAIFDGLIAADQLLLEHLGTK